MERWLSLTVSEEKSPKHNAARQRFLISIPKAIVRLAVRRNRIKRVLREALRNKSYFKENKVYIFKVLRWPDKINLENARDAVHELFHQIS